MPSVPKKRIALIACAAILVVFTTVLVSSLQDQTRTWTIEGEDLRSAIDNATSTKWDLTRPYDLGVQTFPDQPTYEAIVSSVDGDGRTFDLELVWQKGLAPTSITLSRTSDSFRTSDRFEIAYDIDEEAENPCLQVEYTIEDSNQGASHYGVACAGQHYVDKGSTLDITALRKIAVDSNSADFDWVTDYSLFARAFDPDDHTSHRMNEPFGSFQSDSSCDQNSYLNVIPSGLNYLDADVLYVYDNQCVPYWAQANTTIENDGYTGLKSEGDFSIGLDTHLEMAKSYTRNFPDTKGIEWNDIATFEMTSCTGPFDLFCGIDTTKH